MNPDEIAKLIPDEVVEEAAKHAFIYYKSIPWDECTDKNLWRSLARAAIAAGLASWPGVESETGTSAYNPLVKRHRLILPLPKEKSE